MRVLVVGGTGVLGVPVAHALTAAGHDVTVGSRKPRADGGDVVVVDLLDRASVDEALRATEPEVVVHAATALPAGGPRTWSQLAATNTLRDQGTANLVGAAAQCGVRRVVTQSFLAGYAPAGAGAERLAEDAPFGTAVGSAGQRQASAALAAGERHTLSGSVEGIAVRFGFFYGDRADRAGLVGALRRRRLPLPGGARGRISFTHIDDAAVAVRLAVERAAPGVVYNAADDEPTTFGDYVRTLAAATGAPRPAAVPVILARFIAPAAVAFLCVDRPLTSVAIRRDLGWQPQHDVLTWASASA